MSLGYKHMISDKNSKNKKLILVSLINKMKRFELSWKMNLNKRLG